MSREPKVFGLKFDKLSSQVALIIVCALCLTLAYRFAAQDNSLKAQAERLINEVNAGNSDAIYNSLDENVFSEPGVTREKIAKSCKLLIAPMLHNECQLRIVDSEVVNGGAAMTLKLAVKKRGREGVVPFFVSLGDKDAVTDYSLWKRLCGEVFAIEQDLPKEMDGGMKITAWQLSQRQVRASIVGRMVEIRGRQTDWVENCERVLREWYIAHPKYPPREF